MLPVIPGLCFTAHSIPLPALFPTPGQTRVQQGLGSSQLSTVFVFYSFPGSLTHDTSTQRGAAVRVPLPVPCSHPRHRRQTSHPKAEITPLSNPVPFPGMDIMKKPILGSFPQLLGSLLPCEPWAELTRHRCSSDEGDSSGTAMLHPRIRGCSCNYGGETNGGFCFSRHAACWGPCRR